MLNLVESTSLPRSSRKSWDGRYGRYDGLGTLGLALRKFLAFVLELWVSLCQQPRIVTAANSQALLFISPERREFTHHLLHPSQRRPRLLSRPTVLAPIPGPLDDNLVHDYNVLTVPPRRQHPADSIEYLLRLLANIPVDPAGFFLGALQSCSCACLEGRGGDVEGGRWR